MATASLLPPARSVFYDSNGDPLSGGYVYTYVPGGTTPDTTWQEATQTSPNAYPIILDANGSALIYGNGTYQLTVTDSLNNQIPAYSGLSTASDISGALGPVVSAPTILAAANALLASGLTIPLQLMGGVSVNGTSFSGTYQGAPALFWENLFGVASSATLPEVGGQFAISSTLGLGTSTGKIALTSTAIGTAGSAPLWGNTSIVTGFGGFYRLTGYEADINNVGIDATTLNTTGSVYGLAAVAGGTSTSTAGVWVTSSTANWQYGVAVSSALGYAFFENSIAATAVSLAGTHSLGVDFSAGTFSTATILLPNNTSVRQKDFGGISRNLLKVDTANNLQLGDTSLANIVISQPFLPTPDNTFPLGGASNRFTALWAVNGAIQTSDPRLKTDIEPLPDALPIVARINPVTFKWIDGGKGEPGKRTHWGFLASDIKAGFEPTGRDFGGYVLAEDGSEHMRPDQLIPVLWKAVAELSAKVTALEVMAKGIL